MALANVNGARWKYEILAGEKANLYKSVLETTDLPSKRNKLATKNEQILFTLCLVQAVVCSRPFAMTSKLPLFSDVETSQRWRVGWPIHKSDFRVHRRRGARFTVGEGYR
jgi:hypothetical protein